MLLAADDDDFCVLFGRSQSERQDKKTGNEEEELGLLLMLLLELWNCSLLLQGLDHWTGGTGSLGSWDGKEERGGGLRKKSRAMRMLLTI